MESWSVAQRRGEREEKRRQKELERRQKERAKLSSIEQARLTVEAHQNELEILLSVHKEQSTTVDWRVLASRILPHLPSRLARHELAALAKRTNLEEARKIDDREYQIARATYEIESVQWEKMRSLAGRVLAGNLTRTPKRSPNVQLSQRYRTWARPFT